MRLHLHKPGLFITGTDTGVGKTIVTCAIAAVLRQRGVKVGVCKPIATGCRRDREGLVSEDAEALAHFSDCRLPLSVINPVRYHAALAPAVAAERELPEIETPVGWAPSAAANGIERADAGIVGNHQKSTRPTGVPQSLRESQAIGESLRRIEEMSELVLVEGVGGILVPIGEQQTVLDLMGWIGYPVVVVTRAGLGTLNHTAMTCRIIRGCGLRLAGLVINRYHADTTDQAEATNPRWLAKQNETPFLATVPDTPDIAMNRAVLPPEIVEAVGVTDWQRLCATPRTPDR